MNYETAVLQVRAEEPLTGNALRDEVATLRLPQDAFGLGISKVIGSIAEVGYIKLVDQVIVEVHKQARCEELLQAAMKTLLENGPHVSSNNYMLKQLLGVKASGFLCQWVTKSYTKGGGTLFMPSKAERRSLT